MAVVLDRNGKQAEYTQLHKMWLWTLRRCNQMAVRAGLLRYGLQDAAQMLDALEPRMTEMEREQYYFWKQMYATDNHITHSAKR